MMFEGSKEVTAVCRAKKALIYIRQSSERQVVNHRGSTAYQRAQVEHARRLGWSDDAIVVIDDDLGLSGTTTLNRTGYLRTLKLIEAGEAGGLFVSDISRAGRDAIELLKLLDSCRQFEVLLIVDGRVSDFSDSSQLFVQQILTIVAENDNVRRREMIEHGVRARLSEGKAVTGPPAGYVRVGDGKWQKDPDPLVRDAIESIFRIFSEKRSLVQTARVMRKIGLQIPRRTSEGTTRWVGAEVTSLADMLHNPTYKGEYHYGRRRSKPGDRTPSGSLRLRPAAPGETTIILDHHEPYVTASEWDGNQQILELRAPSKDRRNLGPGTALLQGIVRCRGHLNHAMCAGYPRVRSRNGRPQHVYHCRGEHLQGGERCICVFGPRIDDAVIEYIIDRLRPPRLQVIRDAWKRARADENGEQRRHERKLRHAERAVEHAKLRCLAVDPANRHVAAEYEKIWEQEQKALKELQASVPKSECSAVATFDEDAWAELLSLCQSLKELWDAPTTENGDRKELIRSLVKTVIVEERTHEVIVIRIVWVDSDEDTVVEIKEPLYAHRIIEELALLGREPAEIAKQLNAEGMLTRLRRPWSIKAVKQVIRNLRVLAEKREQPRRRVRWELKTGQPHHTPKVGEEVLNTREDL